TRGMLEPALDAQRRERRLRAALDARLRVEAQVMLASRADARAFENRRLAVRANARLARKHDAAGVHGRGLLAFAAFLAPADPRAAAHTRACSDGQRAGLQIA